ncbi:Alpha-hemolysin translocation ATP-binding protein HlyB [Kordia antarctica]|uniref:Alpha-hemolysin translocation ATP-binding protein HlyB n=1 Tax=Kordia antarctica TaxID=1218801 RepID=A0A7L4ZI28_9FLAO|nr:ABC transporter ATP-binding protein [Kordia antarctica]QHI36141.1 Alpha-hemolysin translocation ATP-binding protein HlyB [Kordia antarctica]
MLQFESLHIENLSIQLVGQKQLLKSINIQLIKNQCNAIVCKNEVEQNTFSQILQKKGAYENGTVTINNHISLNEVNIKDWHQMIGVIQGSVKIFPTYALENIVMEDYTLSNKIHRFEDIHEFIQEYGFDDFIQSLPQGYATILGESGVNLSGGQKQILALIRVLYKKPQLLILDEFTSAMDRNTEHFVLQLLKRLKYKISIIFISHRLHSLKQIADHIYVIENGETIVNGSHKELLRTANFYSDFWTDILNKKEALKLIL